jgi:hypothetical protein
MRSGSDIGASGGFSGGLRAVGLLMLTFAGLTLAGPAAAAPAPAAPPPAVRAAAPAADVAKLEAECAQLRAELERANAEVAALKKGDRGLRNDYRLRQRMADAEALARKLTQAEAQLRAHQPPPAPRPTPADPAGPAPGDGPVELEAKADLLADQARRLLVEADGLTRTAAQIRGRQTLRRRAADLERDPFGGVETTKRTMVFGSTRAAEKGSAPAGDSRGGAPAPTSNPPPAAPGAPGLAPGATTAQPSPATPTSAALSPVRTVLDPATLAEVQRLERSGKPFADADALERAAAALRQRAQTLQTQSKSLRHK